MPIDDAELERMHGEGWPPKQLAAYFGCHRRTVVRHLKRLGLTHGPSGEQSPRFESGERLNTSGYVDVLQPEHHHANVDGYVRRSILLWEGYHGRPLESGREIHHIDSDKLNDAPENLLALFHAEHLFLHAAMRKGKLKKR